MKKCQRRNLLISGLISFFSLAIIVGGFNVGYAVENPDSLETSLETLAGLRLVETERGVQVLPETDLIVLVKVDTEATPAVVKASLAGSSYFLTQNGVGDYSASIHIGSGQGLILITVILSDGSQLSESLRLEPVRPGVIYVSEDNSHDKALVTDATLTTYASTGSREVFWDGKTYGYANPYLSTDGLFGFYVPNGTYVVYVSQTNHSEAMTTVTVTNNILATELNFGSVDFIPVTRTQNFSRQVRRALDTPEAETLADIGTPAAAAAAGGALTSLLFTSSLLAYLQYLITWPWLWFRQRRYTTFGVVYNAITKLPIGLATVRAFGVPHHRLVKTGVTSPQGVYVLAVPSGEYRLEVVKPGYTFPSVYLQNIQTDGRYLQINLGQTLVVANSERCIAANIPLDPIDVQIIQTPLRLAWRRLFRGLQRLGTALGLLVSVLVFIIHPAMFTGMLLALQSMIFILVMVLVKQRKSKGWGVITDAQTGKPISNAVIRLFEPKYNKMVESTLSDNRGRYAFLLGPNEYFATVSKPGYVDTEIRPINFKDKTEPTLFTLSVSLEHFVESAPAV